jgi:hypothetical protein
MPARVGKVGDLELRAAYLRVRRQRQAAKLLGPAQLRRRVLYIDPESGGSSSAVLTG